MPRALVPGEKDAECVPFSKDGALLASPDAISLACTCEGIMCSSPQTPTAQWEIVKAERDLRGSPCPELSNFRGQLTRVPEVVFNLEMPGAHPPKVLNHRSWVELSEIYIF